MVADASHQRAGEVHGGVLVQDDPGPGDKKVARILHVILGKGLLKRWHRRRVFSNSKIIEQHFENIQNLGF